jgi:hypothetical protein
LKTVEPWTFNRQIARIAQSPNLFHFFVRRMLTAAVAEFLEFQPLRRRLPILGGRIIPLFAVTAL